MAATNQPLHSLNAGEVSNLALARVDLAKMRVACEQQENWLPHVLGPTQMRPGTQYIAGVPGDAEGWLGEFYFNETRAALLVMTTAGLAFLIDDVFLTRPAASATITNGDFASGLTGWTDSDEAGASSVGAGGLAVLTGTGTNYAQIDQQITTSSTGVEHGIRIVLPQNNVAVKIGSSSGSGDYFDATLAPGAYSIAITPSAGTFWIRFANNTEYPAYVESVEIEAAGTVVLPTPYTTKTHFDAIRYDQSGDVIFVACAGFQQRRIERRASNSRSWGVAKYQVDDGPFRNANTGRTTITPSGTVGNVTLTASHDLFRAGHFGSLWRLTHTSQLQIETFAALNDATGEVRVAGLTAHNATSTTPAVTSTRGILITIDVTSGSFVGTIVLQRSLAVPGAWADVSGKSWTTDTSEVYDDGLDNQIIYYRLLTSSYTSGTAAVSISYAGASQDGIVRITSVTNGILAAGDVLQQIGGVQATSDWAEGEWSDYRGWPTSVALHDGRLTWFGALKAFHSVSDGFDSFDATIIGDSAPIVRTVTTGGLDGIRWGISMQRLLVGTATTISSIRSSSFDEPLTPTAYTSRACSDDGAGAVRALRLNTLGFYVGASKRLFKLQWELQRGDYETAPVDRLKPEMCAAGIADIAVQRKPDNAHVWIPLTDGTVVLVAENPKEEVEAMVPITTAGAIERVAVLPGTEEDRVYFIVRRTIGGVTKRFVERMAKRSECRGGTLNRTSDAHVVYSGALTSTVSAPHLAGQTVAVWADGGVRPNLTLDGAGNGTLPAAVNNYVAGLPYRCRIKTTKLAFGAEHGTALAMQKRIAGVGLVMADVSWAGVRIGRDFDHLQGLPATYRARPLLANAVLAAYDARPNCFNGGWDSDARVCIEVTSPHACTLMGIVLHEQVNESIDPPPAARDGR